MIWDKIPVASNSAVNTQKAGKKKGIKGFFLLKVFMADEGTLSLVTHCLSKSHKTASSAQQILQYCGSSKIQELNEALNPFYGLTSY